MIILWGKNDKIFPAEDAYPYERDLPHVQFHLLDTGHFTLNDKADEMVPLITRFLRLMSMGNPTVRNITQYFARAIVFPRIRSARPWPSNVMVE
jgi:hypothetical protein